MKIIIVANRLPVKVYREENSDRFIFKSSEGGLVTGLDSLEMNCERHWVGWPGIDSSEIAEREEICQQLNKINFTPVFLSKEEVDGFYKGYCNGVLWPLFHYFYVYTEYHKEYWNVYESVNRRFLEAVATVYTLGDLIWIQDYHLMLLPRLLRERLPVAQIGYFHHIPFPSYELFRLLPERKQLLEGMLGADLVGFHIVDYVEHFIHATERLLDLNYHIDRTCYMNRMVSVQSFPMGINYKKFHEVSLSHSVAELVNLNFEKLQGQIKMLSIDRLDYSKGIVHRLDAVAKLFERYPEYKEKVTLLMVVVPSRDTVNNYAELKRRVDEKVGFLNGKYSTLHWRPIHYYYQSFSFNEIVAFYLAADIALVTPLRDGMNLVAKEYVASRNNGKGVLVLSEMAGAAALLKDALMVNPNSDEDMVATMVEAIEMSPQEQSIRMKSMQKEVSINNVNQWANHFLNEMVGIHEFNQLSLQRYLSQSVFSLVKNQYDVAKKRLIVLDYDGTLVPFTTLPAEASPTQSVLRLIDCLAADRRNKIVISSGRDSRTLCEWFKGKNITIAAEHGAYLYEDENLQIEAKEQQWDSTIVSLLEELVDKVPGSHLELKRTAIVWHYRGVNNISSVLRARDIISEMAPLCYAQGLEIMKGNKVVEIKRRNYTKGNIARHILGEGHYDFVLAIGDDTTDEEMFQCLSEVMDIVSVKVGGFSERAKYYMHAPSEICYFLSQLIVAKV